MQFGVAINPDITMYIYLKTFIFFFEKYIDDDEYIRK